MFPLNTVLFPGVSVPLHVFEDRYRALVHHLLRDRGPRRAALRVGRDPRGLRGRRPRRPVAAPGRLPGPADRGRAARRRHLRHRRGRPGPDPARPAGHRRHLPARSRRRPRPDDTRPVPVEITERGARHVRRLPGGAHRDPRRPLSRASLPRDPTYLSWTPGRPAPLPLPDRQSLLEAEDAGAAARSWSPTCCAGAAGHERDPVAARHRGRAHPLVPQLSRAADGDERSTAGVGTPATVALTRAGVAFALHPYDHDPRAVVLRARGRRGARRRPGPGVQDAAGQRSTAQLVVGDRAGHRVSSTSRRWPGRSAAARR